MDEDEALGRTIKVLRTEAGLSRRQLAEGAGVSYPFLSEVENGKKRPSTRTLAGIAEALGVRPHELLAGADARSERRRWFEGDLVMAEVESVSPSAVTYRARAEQSSSDELNELAMLLERMAPDDKARVLDLARRLSRYRI